MRLPAEPILAYQIEDLAQRMTIRHGGTYAGHRRLLRRAGAEGSITLGSADKVAIALGTHPLVLWGKAWEHPLLGREGEDNCTRVVPRAAWGPSQDPVLDDLGPPHPQEVR
ncbi:MAG: hypothetical protein ACRDJK_14465 [Actinomycetota bacterium]